MEELAIHNSQFATRHSQSTRSPVADLVQVACIWEVTARKLGNVHPYAGFQDTTFLDFALSAAAIAPHFNAPGVHQVGRTILSAVEATVAATGQNTNLGMILLLAPMAAVKLSEPFRPGLDRVLANLSREDAAFAFRAIRTARPGGLGAAPEQDVRDEPTVTLLEAMRLAADRDLIAQQYATGYADVLEFGLPCFVTMFTRLQSIEAAMIDLQLRWMARCPDSLIVRKNGMAVANDVRQRSSRVLELGGIETAEGRLAAIELDRHLRSRGNRLNPGATADMIAACLFAALRENKVVPSTPFRWEVEDWLQSWRTSDSRSV